MGGRVLPGTARGVTVPTLWHYTCDHGHAVLGAGAVSLVPGHRLSAITPVYWWPSRFVWLTDMAVPAREPLGLTSHALDCDRTAHRYRVTDTADCVKWLIARRPFRHEAHILETPGTRPAHWWISGVPVPAEYDPP